MKKKYYKILVLSLALIALVLSGIYNEIVVKADSTISISEAGEDVEVIVHISGQVEKEGLYTLELGSRVAELIEKAGGLKDSADMSNVNLAEKLKDGQKLYIPSKDKEKTLSTNTKTNTDEESSKEVKDITLEEFNVMSKNDLEKLPGVGPVLAKNIYDYRNKNGSFMKLDELINVKGIGEKKLESIKSCFK